MNQSIAGEDQEQQDALKNLCRFIRNAQLHLRGFAAEIADGQKNTGEYDADWIQPAQEGNDNRCKSVTG